MQRSDAKEDEQHQEHKPITNASPARERCIHMLE